MMLSTKSLSSLHQEPLLLTIIFIFIFIIFFAKIRKKSLSSSSLPPSPPKLPIIGNLHQLGPFPHYDLHRLSLVHGPLMLIHLGPIPTLVVSSAHAAREIMKTHDLAFSSRPNSGITDRLLYGQDIAFSPYGEYWRQMRRVTTLQLLSNTRVHSFRPIREQEIALMINKIRQPNCDVNNHDRVISTTTVNFYEALTSLTNDVVCRVALGEKYSERERGRRFREMINDFLDVLGVFNIADFVPWLAWVNHFNGLNAKVEKTFRELDSFLEGVIQDHFERCDQLMRTNGGDQGRVCFGGGDKVEDFVDILLRIQRDGSVGVPFSRDNIKAIILVIQLLA